MQIIPKYFPELSEKQIKQFSELQELYEYWNAQINIISRKNISELFLLFYYNSRKMCQMMPRLIQFSNLIKIF